MTNLDGQSRYDNEAAWVCMKGKGKAKRKATGGGGGDAAEAPKGKGGAKDAA